MCLCDGVGARASTGRCVDPHTQRCGYIRLASVSLHFDPAAINTSLLCGPSSSCCRFTQMAFWSLRCGGGVYVASHRAPSLTHTHTNNPLLGFTQMCADDPLRPPQNTCTYASRTIKSFQLLNQTKREKLNFIVGKLCHTDSIKGPHDGNEKG